MRTGRSAAGGVWSSTSQTVPGRRRQVLQFPRSGAGERGSSTISWDSIRKKIIAIFIDGLNLYWTCRTLGLEIDFKNVLDVFAAWGRPVRANYYSALREDLQHIPIPPLLHWLDYNGHTVVTKPAKEFVDANGNRLVKVNMGIEMTIDAMEMAARIDHIVLFSGVGDFRRLVAAIQREEVRVGVVSTLRISAPLIADELRRQAEVFLELEDLACDFAHSRRRPGVRTPAQPVLGAADVD